MMTKVFRMLLSVAVVLALTSGVALAATSTAESTFYQITSFGDLITKLYSYSLSIVGLCVFGMFIYAGIQLMLGGKAAMGTATKIFQDAVIGTVLLYSSYIILNSINSDLVRHNDVQISAPSRNTSSTRTNPSTTTTSNSSTPKDTVIISVAGNFFSFFKAGATCDASASCQPGYTCQGGTCKDAAPRSVPDKSWCSNLSQCKEGSLCVNLYEATSDPGKLMKCCPQASIGLTGDIKYCKI